MFFAIKKMPLVLILTTAIFVQGCVEADKPEYGQNTAGQKQSIAGINADKKGEPGSKEISTEKAPLPSTSIGENGQADAAAPSARKADIVISIENYAFSQPSLTISVGTKVTWVNMDLAAHTATSNDKVFDSGLLPRGREFSYVFSKPGEYGYYCIPHPKMKGLIKVTEE